MFNKFKEHFQLREDGIYINRGRFRDKDYWDLLLTADKDVLISVYSVMETVYIMGDHDGRQSIRRSIKSALDIDLN